MKSDRSTSTRTCPAVRRYILQEHTLDVLASWFQDAGGQGVEDVAVGAGYPTFDGDAIIATVLHPNADRAPGWYEQRDGAAWDDLYTFGYHHDMYYLLQLHTHPPGYSTHHSPRDDIGAFSDRLGFVSIVLPGFARGGIDLRDPATTIHERTARGWRIWPHGEALERLVVVPSTVDLQADLRNRAGSR
jgi:hypothetical protein